jgi:putative sigma-54 modulation protein
LQAQRLRAKVRAQKRVPKVATNDEVLPKRKTARSSAVSLEANAESNGHKPAIARPPGKQTKAAITVHSFPGKPAVVEPHILSASEALAIRPMTVEEAVKEAEFRDRDLLIFRNKAGEMFVLHRRRDGKMELVEIP